MIHYDDIEFDRLADRYLNNEISDSDFDVFQCILEKSEAARQDYLHRVELDTMLYDYFSVAPAVPKPGGAQVV